MNDLEKIKVEVVLKRPVLGEILQSFGKQTLAEYSKTFLNKEHNVSVKRQNEFAETLALEVDRVLGKITAERVKKQILKNYFVSTADHLGPLSHPFFLQANMLAGLSNTEDLTDQIVLACSNVSLNNSSYPRGLQAHIKKSGHLQLNQFSFFPSAYRNAAVFSSSAFTLERLQKIINRLSGFFTKKQIEVFAGIYFRAEVLNAKNYSDQITLSNAELFKLFFPGSCRPLNLVYLNQENLTCKLLQKHFNSQSEIHSLLFDKDCREFLIENFEGLPGAFSFNEQKGTFLFWGQDQNTGLRFRLLHKKGYLESEDGRCKVELVPEEIFKALNKGLILPSMLLNMLVVGGYYGVKCLGGFSQTTYLTKMLDGYKKIFPKAEVGESKTLCGDFIFADIVHERQAFALTGLDLILYKDRVDFEKFIDLCETKTLNEVMQRVMPILHKILYPQNNFSSWPQNSYKPDFSIDLTSANSIIKL